MLQTNAACAGAARDLGTRVALDLAGHDLRHVWLANTDARLEGYSPLIGADENRPQGFRTRLGLRNRHRRENL